MPFLLRQEESRRRANAVIVASRSRTRTLPTTPPTITPAERFDPFLEEAVVVASVVSVVVTVAPSVGASVIEGVSDSNN